jgi:uncharacterized protein GlcG (DUF336 family)
MRNRPTLTYEDAKKVMSACRAEAEKHKWAVSIAVVDDAGNLLLFERLESASAFSGTAAIGKAQASVAWKMPSRAIGELVNNAPALLSLSMGLPLQGGLPLMANSECVGAVAASGAKGSEDEQVAAAGVASLP